MRTYILWLLLLPGLGHPLLGQVPVKAPNSVRVATFNVSLNRGAEKVLTTDLNGGHKQAREVATVIRAVQPDILLINEIDYSTHADNCGLFAKNFLTAAEQDLLGGGAWEMPFHFSAPVNTGEPSGLDLDLDGNLGEPEDCMGFGRFPGQYGMAVLSRFEIKTNHIRTYQKFLWKDLPSALRPRNPDGTSYYSDAIWNQLRLSSKSHWDVPINTPLGVLHVLASHPTPPAFDGPEDRNGCRNHDEVKLLKLIVESSSAIYDDQQKAGGLAPEDAFVIVGDLNCDPHDGDSQSQAITDLLSHPRIAKFSAPKSNGGRAASEKQGKTNDHHKGDPSEDTADFSESVGNLRVDYVLPSSQFKVLASGIYWPEPNDEVSKTIEKASDHHLVWVDIQK